MEQFPRKRSQSARTPLPFKVTGIVNRSSDDNLLTSGGTHNGSNHTARQRFSKLGCESRSCDHDMIKDEHRIVFELGQRISKLPVGNQMKNSMANEMYKGTEGTRRAPSVVAKLMGLDGMPSPHSAHKQSKNPNSDGFTQKAESSGSCRYRKACNNHSCRKIARDQREFKDVYEVRECSRNRATGCKFQRSPNLIHAEDDMANITQKFMVAKRLSTDEKLHNVDEFHGETEVSDSNNYLFLKSLMEPDSLFAKHLHTLHDYQESRCEHVQNLKMSNILNKNINAIGLLADIEASEKIDISMSRECQVGLHPHVSRNRAKTPDGSAFSRSEYNELACGIPTNIVLLKPNLEESRKSAKLRSSSGSSCELLSNGDTHKNGGLKHAELRGKKKLPIPLDISAHKSRESTELAKEVTRQMRNKLGEISFNVPFPGYRGYSADESAHEVSGTDSSYDSYATCPSSHTRGPSLRRKSSASRSAESPVNKEGKKRLSERWKVSHRSQEVSVEAKGSTLGEMLAIYDTGMKLPNLDREMTQDRSSGRFVRDSKLSGAVEPSGISSKDGWRDGCISTLSRSKSLRTAYDHSGNLPTCNRHEAYDTESFGIPKEVSRNGRKNGVNRDFIWKEGSSAGISRLRDRKVSTLQGSQVGRAGKKKSIVKAPNSVHEPVIVNLEAPTLRLDNMLILDSETAREHKKLPGCMDFGDDVILAPKSSNNLHVKYDSSSSGLHETTQEPSTACHIDSAPYSQYRGAQPKPAPSNKEADQPSPVSVLDTLFVEDLSSGSECFERVSAELHGLRMQLQLLKLETGASMLVSSDEEEGSSSSSEVAKYSSGSESWEATYVATVLAEYEFDKHNPDTFIATWHSSEWPAGPSVFKKLEKKHNHELASCSRSDRRLLFDQIKSCILEIAERFTDPQSWSKAWLEAELCKLLEVVKKQEKEDVDEMALLQSNTEWMNLGMYIEDIGCEIGKMMLDELVSEALTM